MKIDDLKFPSCPNCGGRDINVLYATCKTLKLTSVARSSVWPGGIELVCDGSAMKDAENGLLIRYGLQCVKCEKHWFEFPAQRTEAVKEFLEALTDVAQVPTRAELDAVLPATPAKPAKPTAEPPKVWVLTIHCRNDLHYLMPDEHTAREKLVEIVSEWANEIEYPETQAFLDKGMGKEAVDAFFERESDKTKFNYTLDLVDAMGFGENRLNGCYECGYKGYGVFNEDEDGKPYGEIQACDSCQAKDGMVDNVSAAERAGDDGYELFEDEHGRFIVLKRPKDTDPVAAVCAECKEVHKIYDMTHVHGLTVDEAYYCCDCWVGVRTEEDPR